MLANERPENLESLTKEQRNSFCCKKTENGLTLKKSHPYYVQCQIQMFVSGFKETLFAI